MYIFPRKPNVYIWPDDILIGSEKPANLSGVLSPDMTFSLTYLSLCFLMITLHNDPLKIPSIV